MSRVTVMKIMLYCLLIIINGSIPALSSESLPESDHPYANNFERTWTVSEPGAGQIRLHFEYLRFAANIGLDNDWDKVIIYDKYDHELATYGEPYNINEQNIWTDWYTEDTLKVKFVTDASGTDYGFKVDKVETRPDPDASNDSSGEPSSLAESDHPYANNFERTWTILNPSAGQIRLHFKYLQFAANIGLDNDWDKVIIYDKYDHELATYGEPYNINEQNIWTDWYTEDTLKVKFVTDASGTDYGFVIDKLETRPGSSPEITENPESIVPEVLPDDSAPDENKVLTNTELTSSTNIYTLGQSVTLVAKVDTPSEETEEPLGTVTFMDGTTPIGVRDLISGQATFNTSSLSVGSHSITAKYSGDVNFKSSTSYPFTLTVQEQPSAEQDPEKGPNVPIEQIDTESSHADKESTWEKPVFIIIVAIVLLGIIVATRGEKLKTILSQDSLVRDIIAALVSGLILLVVGIIIQH